MSLHPHLLVVSNILPYVTDLGNSDVTWLNVNGEVMSEEQWNDPNNKAMIVKFAPPNKNEPSILVCLNASHVAVEAVMPCTDLYNWKLLLNTVIMMKTVIVESTTVQLSPRSIYIYEGEMIKN